MACEKLMRLQLTVSSCDVACTPHISFLALARFDPPPPRLLSWMDAPDWHHDAAPLASSGRRQAADTPSPPLLPLWRSEWFALSSEHDRLFFLDATQLRRRALTSYPPVATFRDVVRVVALLDVAARRAHADSVHADALRDRLERNAETSQLPTDVLDHGGVPRSNQSRGRQGTTMSNDAAAPIPSTVLTAMSLQCAAADPSILDRLERLYGDLMASGAYDSSDPVSAQLALDREPGRPDERRSAGGGALPKKACRQALSYFVQVLSRGTISADIAAAVAEFEVSWSTKAANQGKRSNKLNRQRAMLSSSRSAAATGGGSHMTDPAGPIAHSSPSPRVPLAVFSDVCLRLVVLFCSSGRAVVYPLVFHVLEAIAFLHVAVHELPSSWLSAGADVRVVDLPRPPPPRDDDRAAGATGGLSLVPRGPLPLVIHPGFLPPTRPVTREKFFRRKRPGGDKVGGPPLDGLPPLAGAATVDSPRGMRLSVRACDHHVVPTDLGEATVCTSLTRRIAALHPSPTRSGETSKGGGPAPTTDRATLKRLLAVAELFPQQSGGGGRNGPNEQPVAVLSF